MNGQAQSSRETRAFAILFVTALVLRLVHLLTIRDSPFFSTLYIDPLMYDEWGLRIAGGEWLSEKPFFLDPLYPYFLGAIFALFGHSFTAVIAIQSLFGALAAPLVFLAALRWFDRRVAWVAGGIAAIYLPGIFFGGLIMKPGLSVFFSALLLWQLSKGLAQRCGPLHWALTGIVFALAALTRGNLVVTIPLIAAWLLLARGAAGSAGERPARWLDRVTERARLVEAGALLAGAVLVLMLPALHNYKVGGEFILTTANAGANFYIGNNPTNETGEYQQLPFIRANPKYEQLDFANEARRRSGRDEMTDREISSFWFGESVRWMRDNPADALLLMWKKVRRFWGAYEIPDSVDYLFYAEYAPVLRIPLPGFGLLAPLCLTGFVLTARRRGWPRLLLVLTALYSATVIVFFVFSRFRMVVAPVFYVLAAHAGVELFRRFKAWREGTGSLPSVLVPSFVFLVFFGFVNIPVRARVGSWSYRIADTVGLPTWPETSADGHFNLGVALAGRAKNVTDEPQIEDYLEQAAVQLRRAIELRGDSVVARDELELRVVLARDHTELGKVLVRRGLNDEAIEIYAQAEELEPRNYRNPHALGIVHARLGDTPRSVEAFARALKLEPRHLASANRLGEGLLELRRYAEARDVFSHALRVDARNERAAEGLRRATAAQGGD